MSTYTRNTLITLGAEYLYFQIINYIMAAPPHGGAAAGGASLWPSSTSGRSSRSCFLAARESTAPPRVACRPRWTARRGVSGRRRAAMSALLWCGGLCRCRAGRPTRRCRQTVPAEAAKRQQTLPTGRHGGAAGRPALRPMAVISVIAVLPRRVLLAARSWGLRHCSKTRFHVSSR